MEEEHGLEYGRKAGASVAHARGFHDHQVEGHICILKCLQCHLHVEKKVVLLNLCLLQLRLFIKIVRPRTNVRELPWVSGAYFAA